MAIDVRIDSAATGGLEIISHIPAERPCRIEGRNGIGKSVAIRLLSLTSGVQAYADDPAAWRSLKRLVGPTRITLTGLAGEQQTASITLTPDLWPDEPSLEIGDWLGLLTLDGSQTKLTQLFGLLDVVHLSGTERLVDTFHRHQARFRSALDATTANLLKSEEQRARLADLADQFAALTPARANRDAQVLRERERALASCTAEHEEGTLRLRELQRAAMLNSMLAAPSGDRQEQLHQARHRDAEAQAALPAARARLDAAIKALSQGNQQQKKRAAAEDRLQRLTRELAKTRATRSETAASLNLPDLAASQADHLTPELQRLVGQELTEAERLCNALRSRQYEGQLTPEQADIRAELTVVLDGAIDGGQGEFIAARLDGKDVSVAQLRDGVARTAASFQPTKTGVALAAALERYQALLTVQRLDDKTRTLAEQISNVQREIRDLAVSPDSDALTAEVAAARQANDQALTEAQLAATEVGQLSTGLLDERAAADAADQIRHILQAQDVDAAELATAVAAAGTRVTRLAADIETAEREIAQLRKADTHRKVRRRDWHERLANNADDRWLLAGLSWDTQQPDSLPWAVLAQRVGTARDTADQLVRDVEGLAGANAGAWTNAFAAAHRYALESEGVKDFADEHLTQALFDAGTVESLDLRENTVTWQTADGQRRTRPLSAFSSGEQALGFIRARLRQLTDAESQNRLIFLDEFGAFVSADRRKPLAELLADDSLDTLSSQIIVVLPLQVDYASELAQTRGELHDRYAARVHEIETHGYFAERFDA